MSIATSLSDWAIDGGVLLTCFAGLIAILNPLGALPLYLGMTGNQTELESKRTSRVTSLTVLATLMIFFLTGESVLRFFNISMPAFRTSGGILILLMAIAMLHGRTSSAKASREDAENPEDRQSIGIVPLAIPLISGPGSISTVILFGNQYREPGESGAAAIAIVICASLVWLVLAQAPRLHRLMGDVGVRVSTRIMGLITAAVAVQFMADGIKGLFPAIAGNASPL